MDQSPSGINNISTSSINEKSTKIIEDIFNTCDGTIENSFGPNLVNSLTINNKTAVYKINKTKNLSSGIRKYIQLRNKIYNDIKIQKIQDTINNKLFNSNSFLDTIDLFFYNKNNYIIDNEVSTENLEQTCLNKDIVENNIEIENKRMKYKNNRGFIDIEAYCSEDEIDDMEYENSSNNTDLDGFIVSDKEDITDDKYLNIKLDMEENTKMVKNLEEYYEKKFNTTKKIKNIDDSDNNEITIEDFSSSKDTSIIEEIDLNLDNSFIEDSNEIIESNHQSNVDSNLQIVTKLPVETLNDNKFTLKSHIVLNKFKKKHKKMFKGF